MTQASAAACAGVLPQFLQMAISSSNLNSSPVVAAFRTSFDAAIY
jgi:hypothetical protein